MESILNGVTSFFGNYMLMSAMIAWLAAQIIKIFTGLYQSGQMSLRSILFSTGGMPSSHSASVMALAVSGGLRYGFSSPIFALAAVFAMVVMIDASGVRYETGKQAALLNKITKELFSGDPTLMNNGLKATIVAYRGINDMDIQFEDGAVREHIFYSAFTAGKIKHPTLETKYKPNKNGAAKHLGETRIMKSGLEATIIEWRSSADIDIRFEDGAVKKGVKSSDFYKGCIGHPKRKKKSKKNPEIPD